jgi:hypothetical protein
MLHHFAPKQRVHIFSHGASTPLDPSSPCPKTPLYRLAFNKLASIANIIDNIISLSGYLAPRKIEFDDPGRPVW